jgi:two-component system cell cycle sensor histidine kinase/response regulator CckA
MFERSSTHLLLQMASALADLAPEPALQSVLAHARELGVAASEEAEGQAFLTLTVGGHTRSFVRVGQVELAAADSELLASLLRLALQRVEENEELRRVRERMTLLSEASFEGLFFHVDGVVIDANQRFSELTGYGPSEVLGDQTMRRCVAPEDLPAVLSRMSSRYEGTYVISAVRKDGSRFRAELQAKQGKLGDRPVRVAAVRDVTERERMEAMLRESETRLTQLAEATFDIIMFSRQGVIVDVLGPTFAMLGYQREQMIGRNMLEFAAPSAAAQSSAALANNVPGIFQAAAITAEGEEVPLEVVAVYATLGGETVRMSALRDMREKQRLANERRALEQALEQSQRLDSLGVLAGGIAHDFNNLLTAVLGNAELLHARLPDGTLRDMAQSIVDASERASSLTAQMLAYAGRSELGPRTRIDLGTLMQDLSTLLAATLSKKAHISLSLEPGSVVLGNRATLTQVLMNLLTNASDALGDEPGTISVRARRIEEPGPRWTRALGEKVGVGQWVLLEVNDSGVGMDEAIQARVFEPFFSTKAKGHGLGLAACVGIVSSHGGAILVESEPGRGSTFSLLLPADAGERSERPEQPAPAPSSGNLVLVVDDEPLVRTHLRHALQSQGYEVVEADSGASALEQLVHTQPTLVVLDMTMPDLSGIEVLAHIRELRPQLPVILASGYHDAILDSPALGFQAFLAKPYTLAALFDAVERVLKA